MSVLTGNDKLLQAYWRLDMGQPSLFLTPLGGLAVQFNAFEALYRGEAVQISTSTGQYVLKTVTSGDMGIGAVYQDATSSEAVYVVTGGLGYVKPVSTLTAAAGNVCYAASSEAGRVNQSTDIATLSTAQLLRVVGTFVAAGSSAGAPALAKVGRP